MFIRINKNQSSLVGYELFPLSYFSNSSIINKATIFPRCFKVFLHTESYSIVIKQGIIENENNPKDLTKFVPEARYFRDDLRSFLRQFTSLAT